MSEPRCLNVLIVNNRRCLIEALASPIRRMGHDVTIADSVPDSIKLPDVVVFGLDDWDTAGFGVTAPLRDGGAKRGPFIVAITDDPVLVTGRRAKEVGAHLVLVKPVELDLLAGVFRRFGELLNHVEGLEPVA